MIFMRALLTDGVQVCQVKAYHTELATTVVHMYIVYHKHYIHVDMWEYKWCVCVCGVCEVCVKCV